MSTTRTFKQNLSTISNLWESQDYDSALAKVEELQKSWPGNSQLLILWSRLVQLQENPGHDLNEAKTALQQAIDLDKTSPAAVIELGYFLDAIEDDPQAAIKSYSEGVGLARKLLIEGLIGQAKGFLQLEKKESAQECVLEILHLLSFEPKSKREKATGPDVLVTSLRGHAFGVHLKGPFADQIEELINEVFVSRSA